MSSNFRPRLNYSNVIATIALFIALGGAAVAAGLPKKSVGSAQLKRGAVTAAAIKKGAVTSGKLAPKSVVAGKLGANAVLPGNIGNGAITSAKLGAGSVLASTIKNGVITSNKLQSKAVTTDKLNAGAVTNPILANGSVTPNKLSNEFGPIVSTLKSGQTLQGTFAIGGGGKELTTLIDSQSYQFPLSNLPTPNLVGSINSGIPNSTPLFTPACPGLGGNAQLPSALGGQLCIYVLSSTNLAGLTVPSSANNRFGFGLEAVAQDNEKPFSAFGLWAVTAP